MRGMLLFSLTEIRLVLRDKSFYLWALLLPIFFVVVFSGISGGGSEDEPRQRSLPALKITNRDGGELSRRFQKDLEEEDLYFYSAETRDVLRELIIPPGFSKKVAEGIPVDLPLTMNTNPDSEASISAKISIYRGIFKFIARERLHIKSPRTFLKVESSWMGQSGEGPVPHGFIHQVPATIITFLMFNLLIYGGITVVRLRERGMLRRYFIMPPGVTGIWFSLLLANLFTGVVVIVMVLLASTLVFPVSFFHLSTLPMILILLIFSLSMSALSIFLGSVLRRQESIIGVSVLLANVLAALGGCWWPLEVVPDFMKRIALFVPAGWAVQSVDRILFFHRPFSSIFGGLGFLLLFALVFCLLSLRFFKPENS